MPNTTIGERIARVRASEPRASFAKRTELNPSTLRSYEGGQALPNSDVLVRICLEYAINSHWLLTGEGSMHPGEPEEQPKQQPITPQTAEPCQRCAKLEAKLDKVEQQRDELVAENKKLLIENGELKEKNATLRERQRKEDDSLLEKQQGAGSTDMLITPKGIPPMRARR